MATALDPQLHVDEKLVEDAALEQLLDQLGDAREDVSEARAALKPIKRDVDAAIEKLDLGDDTAARVGRWRVTRKATPARHVEFDAEASTRISITLAKD